MDDRASKEGRPWGDRVGELAVYPGHGVARIEDLRAQEIAGQQCEFLVLRMLEDDARILIPRAKVDDVGLRAVVPSDDAPRVFEILRTSPESRPSGVTWSRQFRDYQETLRSGAVFEIAEIVRDLLRLGLSKELSFGERKVLDEARGLLVQELAAAQDRAADQIEAEIDALIA